MLCDVDHFKLYNDRHGHLAGDQALRAVGAELLKNCRRGDRAYRFGGEEFLLLLPERSMAQAMRVAERHREAIEALRIPHPANSAGPVLTISAGVAFSANGDAADTAGWLGQADTALYEAKRNGRNRVGAFTVNGSATTA